MSKSKGSAAERELFHILWDKGWAVLRAAGSGSTTEPSCDLLAGKKSEKRKYAIEVKVTKYLTKYFSKEQIRDLNYFCSVFGLTPLIAIKFNRKGWFFLPPTKLKDSGKNFSIKFENAKRFGKDLNQFLK
jgi:Holliday junction resolvase